MNTVPHVGASAATTTLVTVGTIWCDAAELPADILAGPAASTYGVDVQAVALIPQELRANAEAVIAAILATLIITRAPVRSQAVEVTLALAGARIKRWAATRFRDTPARIAAVAAARVGGTLCAIGPIGV